MPPPWRIGELCGVHGPQRQAGASPFLSDNIHDDWDPAEDARVGSRWCGGGLSYGDDDDDDDDDNVDDKE
jgi:hypothetical protein